MANPAIPLDEPQSPTHTFRQIPDAIADIGDPYVTQTMHALMRIARGNDSINASRQYIAKVAKISPRKVADCIAILCEHGWIKVDHRHGDKGFASNSITFTTPDTYGTTCTQVRHDMPNPTAQDAVPYGTTCTTNRYVTPDTSLRDVVNTHARENGPKPDAPSEKAMTDKRASRIAEDFTLPADWVTAAKTIGITHDVQWQFDAFMDYHLSKGSKFVDWKRAWQTWCRNQITWNKRGPITNHAPTPVSDQIAEAKAERERLQSGNWLNHYERRLYGMDAVARDRRIEELDRIIEGVAA